MQLSSYPGREEKIEEMFYKGNLLLLGLDFRLGAPVAACFKAVTSTTVIPDNLPGKRVWFKKTMR